MSFRTRVPNKKWRTGWDAAGGAAIPTDPFPAHRTHHVLTGSKPRPTVSFAASVARITLRSSLPLEPRNTVTSAWLQGDALVGYTYSGDTTVTPKETVINQSLPKVPSFGEQASLGCSGAVGGVSSSEFRAVFKAVSPFQSQIWWRPRVEERVKQLLKATPQHEMGLMWHNQNDCESVILTAF